MAEPISIQQLKDASEDAISLAEFINKPENVMIPRRLASDIHSLQYYLEYMKSFAQRSYETYDEMVANASNLSENVSVFVTNDLDTSKNGIYTYNGTSFTRGEYQPENAAKEFVEAKLGSLEIFDGKVRAQDVSTEDGGTQDVKNTEFRNELDALPFDDGVLADTLVTTTANGVGSVTRTQHDKNSDMISVKDFGAKGDGITDDTSAFQAALDRGGVIIVPSGTYLINPSLGLDVKNGTIIYMSEDAVIKNIPHNLNRYQIFRIDDRVNVKLSGGLIDGNKSQNSATSGEHGHGVVVRGSTNVTIDTRIQNCWGDGLYIGRTTENNACYNISVPNLTTSGNRRQGISIISVNGLNGGTWIISDIGGTLPESGVDIELNFSDEVLLNIEIDTIIVEGVSGNGLEINLSRFKNTDNGRLPEITADTQKVGIHVKTLEVSNTAKRAISAVNSDFDFVKGYIKIDSVVSKNNGLVDVQATNWSSESVDVQFGDIFVYTNQDKVVYSPIRTSGQPSEFSFGGVSVKSLSIFYDDGIIPTTSPIEVHVGTPATNPIKNVSIGDIKINRDVTAIKKSVNTFENVNIKPSSHTSRKFTSNVTVSSSSQRTVDYYEYIAEPTGANPYPTFIITEISKGHKFKITGNGVNGARLRVSAGVEIIGINSNGDNVTYVIPSGDSVYVEAIDNQKLLITSQGLSISNNALSPSLSFEPFTVPANSSVSKHIPHYNLGSLNSVFVDFNTFIGNIMVQAVKDTSNNRVTLRFNNILPTDVTVPAVTARVGYSG